MVKINVQCPVCKSEKVSKNGVHPHNKQRYICNNSDCKTKSFLLEYSKKGSVHGIDEKIISMAINSSGIRDTARVLGISKQKVQNSVMSFIGEMHQIMI